MIVRLRLGVSAAALALGALCSGCILGPKQDDPADRLENPPVVDSGTGFATDGASDTAAPGTCGDDGSHVNEAGTHYDACPPSADSGSFDAAGDSGIDANDANDGDGSDAPEAIDGEAGIVDDGTTGD